jgi:hypothetical protein
MPQPSPGALKGSRIEAVVIPAPNRMRSGWPQ